jgi:D-3-phosphoglycerate dehydrogenase
MPRVLISDKLEAPGLDLLRQAGIELDERHGLSGAALQEALRAADGVIVRSGTRITAELLEDPGRLRAIVRAGVGVDNIDVAAATRKGIVVMNTPGGNTVSTAEHTLTLLMALARHIPAADASVRQGKWERNKFVGTQLAGKTLGVVGLGRIGREVARRAAGLDMKVVGFDPFLAPERAAQLGIEAVESLDRLLPRCDFLTVHTPLTEETRDLVGAAQLALLPNGAVLVHTARGGIVDEAALLAALDSGQLAWAGVDVFEKEPLDLSSPLRNHPRVLPTPHLAANTPRGAIGMSTGAAESIVAVLAGRLPALPGAIVVPGSFRLAAA